MSLMVKIDVHDGYLRNDGFIAVGSPLRAPFGGHQGRGVKSSRIDRLVLVKLAIVH